MGRSYAKTTLLQILARIFNQGSQNAIAAWSELSATKEVLATNTPSKQALYDNLVTLNKCQARIEDRLYKFNNTNKAVNIYLYDVTSSYLEGMQNELAEFGYNRDKKKGKKQIVIGLLCDGKGRSY